MNSSFYIHLFSLKSYCSFTRQTRSIAPRRDIEDGGEDLWNQITRDKKGISSDNAVTTKRRATIDGRSTPAFLQRENSATKIQSLVRMVEGKKTVKNLKEGRRKSVPDLPPKVGDRHKVDKSLQLKRQNSATKIQSLARMKKGKEKVKTIREQRRMTAV